MHPGVLKPHAICPIPGAGAITSPVTQRLASGRSDRCSLGPLEHKSPMPISTFADARNVIGNVVINREQLRKAVQVGMVVGTS
jgi:hypothetical protein